MAYFIADDRVYFLNKFSPADLKMLENHFDDITDTLASLNFDTTGLDFVNHGTNVGFDMPTITMYRYEDGKYKKLWSEGDYRNSEAVDTIQSIFQNTRSIFHLQLYMALKKKLWLMETLVTALYR